jgi:hypothetical protein
MQESQAGHLPCNRVLNQRIRAPAHEDWSKLVHMMCFLKGTAFDLLTLRADGSRVLKWFTDASFAVHPDLKSQTGVVMMMGSGAVTSVSRNQGMNSRNSTEAELIASDEVVGPMLWTWLFFEAQRYPVKIEYPTRALFFWRRMVGSLLAEDQDI